MTKEMKELIDRELATAQSGTFECPIELSHTSSDFGVSKMPTGWTVNTL